jgi:hypothetical protein
MIYFLLINNFNLILLQVLEAGKGELVVARRPGEESRYGPADYLPCEYCYKFVMKHSLHLHIKTCCMKPAGDQDANFMHNSRIMLAPFLNKEIDRADLDELLDHLKESGTSSGVKQICQEDRFIREFGIHLLDKLGTEDEQ